MKLPNPKMSVDNIYEFCSTICHIIEENDNLKNENAHLRKELEWHREQDKKLLEIQKESIADTIKLCIEKTAVNPNINTEDPCLFCTLKNCSYYGPSPCSVCEKPGRTMGLNLTASTNSHQDSQKNDTLNEICYWKRNDKEGKPVGYTN